MSSPPPSPAVALSLATAPSESPTSPISMDPPLKRCTELWFSDCGLIVRAENVIFRVSRGMLAARSTVFADMFALPQPEDTEMIEGCPVVTLPDTAEEVTAFFKALFDLEFFKPYPAETDYPTVRAVLRLSNKYDVDPLRKRALFHLDQLIKPCTRQRFQSAGSIAKLVNLCREVSALWLLPQVFYVFSSFDPEEIIPGYLASSGDSADPLILSQQDQRIVLRGAMILRGQKMSDFFDFIWHPAKIEGCACISPGACFASRTRLRRRVEQMKRTELPLEVPFDIQNISACEVCKKGLRKGYQDARKNMEDSLPEVFGLPSWIELNDMRDAALE